MLSKLKILAFSDDELRSKVSDYTVQINPDSYNQSHPVGFSCAQGVDSAGKVIKYNTQPSQGLNFEFVLDSTGAVPGVRSVTSEVKKFKNLVYTYHGENHTPNRLKVIWGGLAFKCMLSNLDLKYELFDPSGKPIRVKVIVAFQQYQTPKELALRADKKSADLSHSKIVSAGTTLPLMTYRVYNQSDLYVHVARANKLNDLMHLDVGSEIRFPPSRDEAHD